MDQRLVAQLTCELRTPVANAIGFLELIGHPQVGELNAKQREYLGDVMASARTILEIIDDLQTLTIGEIRKPALKVIEGDQAKPRGWE